MEDEEKNENENNEEINIVNKDDNKIENKIENENENKIKNNDENNNNEKNSDNSDNNNINENIILQNENNNDNKILNENENKNNSFEKKDENEIPILNENKNENNGDNIIIEEEENNNKKNIINVIENGEENILIKENNNENNNDNENIENKNDNNMIINIHNNEEQDNINIEDKKDKKSQYKYNFSALINKMIKESDDNLKINNVEFNSNILLMHPKINISNKICCLSLISFINFEKNNSLYSYYINNKIYKYLSTQKGIENFYYIKALYRLGYFLEKDKNYFYAFKCIVKAYDLLEKSNIDKKSFDKLNDLLKQIQKDIVIYSNKSLNKFMKIKNENNLDDEKYNALIKLIKDLIENSYNNDVNNNEYLYLVNKKWIEKLNDFMEKYKLIRDNIKDNKKFFRICFETNNIVEGILNNNNKKDEYTYFPGPIDNYSISDWKDFWIDPLNKDENNFIKNNYKDYYLLKKTDFDFLKEIFEVTNIIKRKKNELDFVEIKTIIFDKRFKDKNYCFLLRKKSVQIKKTATIFDLKEKIIRCINNVFNNIDKNNKCNVYFYVLDKDKKNILMEMCISFINNINTFDCFYINKINISENENISKLISAFDEKKKILITEIQLNNDSLFIKEIVNNKYICTECKKDIDLLENIYNYNICHLSLFCSEKCANKREDYKLLESILKNNYLVKEFNLNSFLKKDLLSLFKNNDNSKKGLVGLVNLGNTCYMNSSLQCLSNTYDLTKYFLMNLYENDINFANNFGTQGTITLNYYKLIYNLWYGNEDIFSPEKLLKKIQKKYKIFAGYNQQDAQEFLSILLDNLHQDLNLLNSKSDSIINTLFNGQLKSEIICQKCKTSSITYQPFTFLSLPIPKSKTICNFNIFCDLECKKYNFEFYKGVTLYDLKNNVIEFIRKDQSLDKIKDLEICRMNNQKEIKQTFLINKKDDKDNIEIESILNKDDEILFYGKETEENEGYYNIFIYFAEEKNNNKKPILTPISYPLYYYCKKDITFKQLQEKIIERLKLSNFLDQTKMKLYQNKKNDIYKILDLNLIHSGVEKCKHCKKECDTSLYCSFFKIVKKNSKLKDSFGKAKNVFMLATSECFNLSGFVYLNSFLFLYDFGISSSSHKFNSSFGLKQLISLFNEREILQKNEKWCCPKCKINEQSTKKIQIHKSPNYLLIHFKRFKNEIDNNDTPSFKGGKNKVLITFPIKDFDISEFIDEPKNKKEIYDLYAIIQHFGNLNSGHYKAICKNNNKWILYDDDKYEEITNLVNENAYILFYKRKNLENLDE